MKRLVVMSASAIFIGMMFFASIANAEVFEGTGFYEMKESDTLEYGKEQAQKFAERRALEEAYVSVDSVSESEKGFAIIDEIIAESEGLISVLETKYKIEPSNGADSFVVRATVKVEIDMEHLKKQLESKRQK